VRTGEHAGEFHAVDLLHQGRQQFTHLDEGRIIPSFVAELNQNLQVIDFTAGRGPVVNQLDQGGPLFQDLLSAFVVIPEVGFGDFGFQFTDPLTLAIDVKDTSSALRACP